MKAYVITTGVVFALLAAAHAWRMVAEGPRLATDPFFLAITVAAAALATWAAWVLRRANRP